MATPNPLDRLKELLDEETPVAKAWRLSLPNLRAQASASQVVLGKLAQAPATTQASATIGGTVDVLLAAPNRTWAEDKAQWLEKVLDPDAKVHLQLAGEALPNAPAPGYTVRCEISLPGLTKQAARERVLKALHVVEDVETDYSEPIDLIVVTPRSEVPTLADLCGYVIARRNIAFVPRAVGLEELRQTLEDELRRAARHVEERVRGRLPPDSVADAALSLAAFALSLLEPQPHAEIGSEFAPIILEYPSQVAWWNERKVAYFSGDEESVDEWWTRVQQAAEQALAVDDTTPIAGDSTRNTELKALIRLCVEFAAWSASGSGDLGALNERAAN